MIQPEEIRSKAERLYPAFLKAWLDDTQFFPYTVRSNKNLRQGELRQSAVDVQRLRNGSREVLGYGYTIEWQQRRSRDFGLNAFPARVIFETQADFLRFINRQSEFQAFQNAVVRLREEFPSLNGWVRSNRRLLIECAGELEGLLQVLHYLRSNPRPNQFSRELPIPVDTKFIERHERVLRQWLDIVLPHDAVRADEYHFCRRYGLRYAEPHWLVRLLDPALQRETGFPCSEFSIPIATLAELRLPDVRVFIVENKVNLLTLPLMQRTLALGGVGRAATELRQVPWLREVPITYWGDIDVEGLNILSAWRALFPQTRSLFMDLSSVRRFESISSCGTGAAPDMPPNLTDEEQGAFDCCRSRNLRIEQERIPQSAVMSAIGGDNLNQRVYLATC